MKTNLLRAYAKVWLKLTSQQFEQQVANTRVAAVILLFGKFFRFATALILVYVIVGRAKLIAGYNLQEAVFILALFNFFQTITQLFLRAVYIFRDRVQSGSFDFYLLNPLSELFYSLFSYTDPLDMITTVPYGFILFWAWAQTSYPITITGVLLVLALLAIAMIMVISWHIIVISIGIKYMEVDNTIMLYRDIERMAAFPVDIYGRFGSTFLTYVMPFALMATVPAKIIFGIISPASLILFALLAIAQLQLALFVWRRSLLSYSSASS